jgi:hypothetical protein
MPTEEVRPDSISCLWRKRFTRDFPRPSSKVPLVRTPSKVDFPASTVLTSQLLMPSVI